MLKIAKSKWILGRYYSKTQNYTLGLMSEDMVERVINHEELHRVLQKRISACASRRLDWICREDYYSMFRDFLY